MGMKVYKKFPALCWRCIVTMAALMMTGYSLHGPCDRCGANTDLALARV